MLARNLITIDESTLRTRPVPLSEFPTELKSYAINFCYKATEYAYKGAYLSEILKDKDLVLKLQNYLQSLKSSNSEASIPLKSLIECKDILHPNSIPGIELCFDDKNNKWDIPDNVPLCFYTTHNLDAPREEILNPFGYTLLQNDKFLLIIRDSCTAIELYIYKK